MNIRFTFFCLFISLAIPGCAEPPLNYYTLSLSNNNSTPQITNFTNSYPILYINPITLPDYLNTTDIVIRNQSLVISSYTGRLSSILSNEITNFITSNLAQAYPKALITNQNPFDQPTYQLIVNIISFDIQKTTNKQGKLICEALWYLISSNENIKTKKYQTLLTGQGSINSDENIIALEQKVLQQLTQKISQTLQPIF